ncbi:hypothetical protein [Salinisphaera sp. LB1]|uniref:hypothetical protein n=1 Tax=Salinisphaera sp. LB1 TaxID=2183911 RepID=UPI002101C07E|nr:hypothetical protein [Salinisphaera sp. LB1]
MFEPFPSERLPGEASTAARVQYRCGTSHRVLAQDAGRDLGRSIPHRGEIRVVGLRPVVVIRLQRLGRRVLDGRERCALLFCHGQISIRVIFGMAGAPAQVGECPYR